MPATRRRANAARLLKLPDAHPSETEKCDELTSVGGFAVIGNAALGHGGDAGRAYTGPPSITDPETGPSSMSTFPLSSVPLGHGFLL